VGRIYENGSLYAELLQHASELDLEVAEHKRAEAALRENKTVPQRLRGHERCDGLTDLNHRFVRANAAFARLFGYSESEVLRCLWVDVTHPDDVAKSLALREGLLAGRATSSRWKSVTSTKTDTSSGA